MFATIDSPNTRFLHVTAADAEGRSYVVQVRANRLLSQNDVRAAVAQPTIARLERVARAVLGSQVTVVDEAVSGALEFSDYGDVVSRALGQRMVLTMTNSLRGPDTKPLLVEARVTVARAVFSAGEVRFQPVGPNLSFAKAATR